MERISRFRAILLLILFITILALFALKLFDLQIIKTNGNTDNIAKYTTVTTVRAARGDRIEQHRGVPGLDLDPYACALLKFLEDGLVDRFLVRGENDQTVPLSGREGGDVLRVRAAAAGEQKQADEQQTAAAHNGHPS